MWGGYVGVKIWRIRRSVFCVFWGKGIVGWGIVNEKVLRWEDDWFNIGVVWVRRSVVVDDMSDLLGDWFCRICWIIERILVFYLRNMGRD